MKIIAVILLAAILLLTVSWPASATDDTLPPPPPDEPVSSISEPVNGAVLTAVPILVKGLVSDQDGIAKVELMILGPTGTTTVPCITVSLGGTPTPTPTATATPSAPTPTPTPTPSATTSPSPTPTATPSVPSFSDLNEHWAEALILSLTAKGIISGYPDGTFQPDRLVSRAEFSAILCRALNLSPSTNQGDFSDLSSHWAKGYVLALVEEGFIKGYPDGAFAPDALIKRAEIAAIMSRVKALLPVAGIPTFSDVNVGYWAFGQIEACAGAKIVSGYPDGAFHPESSATRAEASAVIARGLGL
ncbi:MAG: S-layer homology domain-containing protein [Coprothermobacterota bacterium]|nr:S-layer homology domain-containing protein [Coprothermobacterota bacterium]